MLCDLWAFSIFHASSESSAEVLESLELIRVVRKQSRWIRRRDCWAFPADW